MERNRESRRKLDERAKTALRMISPHVRDLDPRSTLGIEVNPLQVVGWHEDGFAGSRPGLCNSGSLRENHHHYKGRRQRQDASRSHRGLIRESLRGSPDPYFFAGAFAPTTLRSNFPVLWAKNTHSEALSQLVVCL